MKKLIMAVFLTIIFLSQGVNLSFAVSPAPTVALPPVLPNTMQIPFVNCGVANGDNGTDKCCYNKPFSLDIPGRNLIEIVPGIGDMVKQVDQKNQALQQWQQLNQVGCSYGQATLNGNPTTDYANTQCKCALSVAVTPIPVINLFCQKYLKGSEATSCSNCVNAGGWWSGLGCVPLRLESFVSDFLLKTGIGMAGIMALLCIIFQAFNIQTSRGNPEKIKKTQEALTSCIIGLVLIIFSVFILRVIGVDILRIPGFGK